jgi:hypothetical protein
MDIPFTTSEVAYYYAVRFPHLRQTTGSHWRGTCPIHFGKHRNFSVNSATGQWTCFSKCGHGSLIDLEMALTGADFKSALAEILFILRRPQDRKKVTREEWQEAKEVREREAQDRRDAFHFAEAAIFGGEYFLEIIEGYDDGRSVLTALVSDSRKNNYTAYLKYRQKWPELTAALVDTGRRLDLRLQTKLLCFIEAIASEGCHEAA